MIGDVDKADILTCLDELMGDCLLLLQGSIGSPAGEVDDRNGRCFCSHDVLTGTLLATGSVAEAVRFACVEEQLRVAAEEDSFIGTRMHFPGEV